MFGITEDGKSVEFPWYDGKKYQIKLSDGNQELNFNEIFDTYKKIIEDRDVECKTIVQLGAAFCLDKEIATGFLMGWIFKSLKDSYEKTNNSKFAIQVESEEISKEQWKEYTVSSLRALADKFEKEDTDKLKSAPVVKGDVGGFDLF